MNSSSSKTPFLQAGVARRVITPPLHVELAGLGYYLNRTPTHVRDDLTATGLVISDPRGKSVALVAVDLMYADATFARSIREAVAAEADIAPEAICVNCSHTHNGPTAAFVRGVGELDADYVRFAAKMAAEALVEAWRKRQPVTVAVGAAAVSGYTFNRTRENGPMDTRMAVLRVDTAAGRPLAIAVNYHSHLTAHQNFDLHAVSRDWSGEMIDQIEAGLPGIMAMYLQGTCGDVMTLPEFSSTPRRFEPASAFAKAALEIWRDARALPGKEVDFAIRRIALPTRRWTRDEVTIVRDEAVHRLKAGDTEGWLNGFARVIVGYPGRLPSRYGGSVEKTVAAVSRFGVEWADAMLPILDTRPETIETEVQALRLDDVWFAANSTELFSSLGLEARHRWPHKDLFMLGYSNGSLGYLPDAYDVERQSYAANQSPKFTGQFPFTAQSGDAMVQGLLDVLKEIDC